MKLLGIPGHYTLALDRTNWKVGAIDINILMLSIVYRDVGIPVVRTILKLKKHGYPPKSVFRRGLDILCRLVTNFERFDVAV